MCREPRGVWAVASLHLRRSTRATPLFDEADSFLIRDHVQLQRSMRPSHVLSYNVLGDHDPAADTITL